jgi:hypothetical protein
MRKQKHCFKQMKQHCLIICNIGYSTDELVKV